MPRRPRPACTHDGGPAGPGLGRGPGLGLGLAATALGAVALLFPDRLRLDHRFPGVDVVAWRPHAAAVTGIAAALLATGRRTRPAAAVLGTVAAAAIPVVAGRAIARHGPPAAGTELTVLALNVLRGRADTLELATLMEREKPDLVALSEAGTDFRDKLMPLVAGMGYRSWVSTMPGIPDGDGVTLLASGRAGDLAVRSGPEMRYRHLEATGGILGSRRFVVAHTAAPMQPPSTRFWRADMAQLARWCDAEPAPIVAGDLNATVDHSHLRSALGRCRSAAEGTGRGLVGTFPSSLPRWAGIQIDHVLVPAEAQTVRFEVIDVAGSDHRAVLVDIRLP